MRAALFAPADRPGYSQLRHSIPEIKPAIFSHPEFTAFNAAMSDLFAGWKATNRPHLAGLTIGSKPKELIAAWEPRLTVTVNGFFVQQMKTKWGSCNPISHTIRLNTELAKKPIVCLEYIVAHEMLHLLEPTHSARFTALLDRHMPNGATTEQL